MYRFTVSRLRPRHRRLPGRHPALTLPPLEKDALLLAVTEPISASQEPGRGQGLCQALQTARLPGNTMMVHSRTAILNLMAHGEPIFNTVPAHPGTIVYMTFQA